MKKLSKPSLAAIICILCLLTGTHGGQARSVEPRILSTDWTLTAAMNAARQYHTLSVLPDGTALAAGGMAGGGVYLNSSEIYHPTTNNWSSAGNLTTHRSRHTATVLLDGRVLAVGGESGTGALSSAEVFNPATQQWTATGSLSQARYGHTATRLTDGRVLVVGGCSTGTLPSCTTSAELFNPTTGTWSSAAALPTGARRDHTATLLSDGSVLVAGGYNPIGTQLNPPRTYNTAYRYDPTSNTWSAAGSMSTAAPRGRALHNAVLRRDGKVMVVGGEYYYQPLVGSVESGQLSSSEVYDPATNTWSDLGKPIWFARIAMASVLDAEGAFILLGGDTTGGPTSDVEYLDINAPADTWHLLFGDLNVQRRHHAAVILPGGVILVAGGRNQDGQVVNSAETNRFTSGSADPSDLRQANYGLFRPSATLMPNGDVLITGGGGENAGGLIECHNYVHRWVYADDTFTDVPVQKNMHNARCAHSTTLLPDGRVVVIGGFTSIGGGTSGPGEIFDGTSWSILKAGGQVFDDHKAVLLPDGKLFLFQAGGMDSYIFDPADLSFRKTLNQAAGTYTALTATLMKNGKILILGSLSSDTVEVFDPGTETYTTVPHPSPGVRFNTHEAVLLPNGKVLVAGGRISSGQLRRETFYFNPDTNTWANGPLLPTARRYFSMLLLPDGRPVITGGFADDNTTTYTTTEVLILDSATNAWLKAGDMLKARQEHFALMTLTGKILIIGGRDEGDNPISNVERFNFANISTAPALWKTTVTTAECAGCTVQKSIRVTGSQFTPAWEGSSGLANQSAGNQPLVQLYRLNNGQMQWLSPGAPSSDTLFLSAPVDFPDGPAIAFVYVNGSFQGKLVLLTSETRHYIYLPAVLK
ncbi:MAG: hypothetical protein HY835_06330 [Anaerolineae bacterium]|nr:hypothetical protein [Anaerolineae bacterium]